MRKYKIVAAALVTVSLVGTLTWTAFAAKANFVDAPADNTNISTFSNNLKNLLSGDTADDDSAAADRRFRDKKSSGFGIGMGMNSELICEVLGMTKEELSQRLKDNDGNIYKVLEDAGKVDEYKAAVLAECREELDKNVADGKLTREKADEIYASIKDAIDKFDGSAENNFRMRIGEKSELEDMPDDRKSKIEEFKNKLGDLPEKIEQSVRMIDTDVICEILGMTKEELSQHLKDNDGNIYKILEESGKLEEYKAAALGKYKESLDKKVADGKLTQEKADEMYASMKESLDNFDGNFRINFHMDADELGDEIREKFQFGDGVDFGRRGKGNSTSSSASLSTTKGL